MNELKQKVFSYLKSLEEGQVVTYKQLAEKFNTSPRAIAKIVSSNSDKSVPCYKVIRSDGNLGGYNGLHGRSKEKLLKEEGIDIESLKKGQ